MVEWGQYGFCEEVVAVEAFVELVACSVFSIFDEAFSFFLLAVSALYVLTGYWNDASWARHNIVQIRSTILTKLNWDTAETHPVQIGIDFHYLTSLMPCFQKKLE